METPNTPRAPVIVDDFFATAEQEKQAQKSFESAYEQSRAESLEFIQRNIIYTRNKLEHSMNKVL